MVFFEHLIRVPILSSSGFMEKVSPIQS